MTGPHRSRLFLALCLFEISLVGLAWMVAWPLDRALFADLRWTWFHATLGLAAAVPLFLLFRALLRTRHPRLAVIREFLDRALRPLFAGCSTAQLAALSLAAGIGEEVLFRDALQGVLSEWAGPAVGLVAASALFGAAHPVSLTYAAGAGVFGLYLGALWQLSGNLLAPIVCHAAYDFLALYYYLRVWNPAPSPRGTGARPT